MNSKLNLKRPQRIGQEDEDELLAFQEQFLKIKNASNDQPAAKCVRKYPESEKSTSSEEKSKEKEKNYDLEFEADNSALSMVLSEVVEKSFDWKSIESSQTAPKSTVPKIEKIDFKSFNTESKFSTDQKPAKKKSLFAQNLERQGKLKSFYNLEKIHQTNNLASTEQIKEIEKNLLKSKTDENKNLIQNSRAYEKRKQIITGEGIGNKNDVQTIHKENLQQLSQMSSAEIKNEQEKIIQQMDPKLVAFIRQKKFNEKSLLTEKENLEDIEMSEEAKSQFVDQLPIKPDKKWLNMDKIEYDKLEWMTNPGKTIKTDDGAASAARFNFLGEVMHSTDDVPITAALHHHGSEPDIAGYTLDELFHLARSNFNQQRVIALQTLGNILAKCHSGYYYEIIKSGSSEDKQETKESDKHNLLNQLIEGGVLFLLRWSLDDQTESIINASLNAIRNLIHPIEQEEIFDLTFDLYKGHEMVSLQPFAENFSDLKSEDSKQNLKLGKDLNVEEKKELDELTDEEYIKYDLIKGLFRMNIIARFFYLLNAYKPSFTSDSIIKNIFSILSRSVRHSTQISHELINKYTTFLDLIVEKFLPKFIDPTNTEAVANTVMALKLMRLLASASSGAANKLFEKYDLKTILFNYLTFSTQSAHLVKLHTETVRVMKTFNFLITEKIVKIIDFELMIKHIKKAIDNLTANKSEYTENVFYLQSLLSLFSGLVKTCNQTEMLEMSSGVLSIVQTFLLNKFKFYFSSDKHDNLTMDLNLMSLCLNFIVDYLDKSNNYEKRLEVIDYLNEQVLQPLLENDVYRLKFDNLIMSRLLSNSTSTTEELMVKGFEKIKGNNLSYLPTVLNFATSDNASASMLGNISPFCFMIGFVRLFSLCLKFRIKNFEAKNFLTTHRFLNNEYLKSYLKMFNRNNSQGIDSMNSSYLIMKYENYFVYNCLKLAFSIFNLQDDDTKLANESEQVEDITENDYVYIPDEKKAREQKNLYYLTSLSLILKFKSGDEYFLHDILAICVFNMEIWSIHLQKSNTFNKDYEQPERQSANILIKHFENMKLTRKTETTEVSYLNYNHKESEIIKINPNTINSLESLILENLNQIKLAYLSTLLDNRLLENSRKLNLTGNFQQSGVTKLSTLFLSPEYSNQYILKSNWIYAPILFYLSMNKNISHDVAGSTKDSEIKSARTISTISSTLKFIYLLEIYQSDYLEKHLEMTARYMNLLYVYLFESEVFLDKQIVTYMYLILFKYSNDSRQPLEKLNFDLRIPGVISFFDFYKNLLEHYDSTSFGDYLFSQFIIVPLQQKYSHKYRQLFWSDYFHLFKYIKCDKISTELLIPMKAFVEPYEKSLNIIRQYSQILLDSGDVEVARRSKFAYTILIAHLNSFIFEQTNEREHKLEFDFKKLLMQKFLALGNEKLKHDLINYKCLNPIDQRQEFFTELPSLRKKWLDKLLN